MAWNKPSTENQQQTKPNAKAPSAKRGILAGAVIVVALGALCLYLFSNGEATSSSLQKKDRGRIREVAPAAAPKSKPEKPKDPPGYWNGKKITNENRPPWMNPYHRVVDYGPMVFEKRDPSKRSYEERIFDNAAEQQIAELLNTSPGTAFVGEVDNIYDDFNENFAEALKSPIIINKDDPEDVVEMKKAVIQVKEDLKKRAANGENLQKLMEDSWRELRDLGVYKEEIKEQIDNILEDKPELSEKDVEDCVNAANLMLEDRGCAPIANIEMYKERVRLEARRRVRTQK